MSEDTPSPGSPTPVSAPPVSSFRGPVGELIAQRMLLPPPRPGVLAVLGQFEVLRVLGAGGMGIVLLARDLDGQDAAIKLVRSELVANQDIVRRFLKEAGHLKRLKHTNIVPVQEISDRAEGPYFVMPYFEKGSLANRIRPGQPMDPESILEIAAQVAEGLSFAHRSGIIHRDLKPANILLASDGKACLADFGLARTLFNDTVLDVESRQMEGTAPYVSPAVAAGDAEDTRCDIYSFGALLYEMLTGQPPYAGRGTRQILDQIIAGPPCAILSINANADRRLAAVAGGCMARELRDRYADMRDVLADLQRIRENQEPFGHRGVKAATVGARKRGRALEWTVLTVVLVALTTWVILHKPNPVAPPGPIVKTPPSPDIKTPPAPTPPPQPRPTAPSVITLAGQVGVGGYADGPGNLAQFRLPSSVAVDSACFVYVADSGGNTIRKITPDGVVSTLAGSPENGGSTDGTGGAARFRAPFGVAADGAGNVYVADSLNNTIRKITPEGVVSTLAGSAGHPGGEDGVGTKARFRNPWAVAVDGKGNVYVADSSNHAIRKITPDGVVTTLAGLAGSPGNADGLGSRARFNAPCGVAVDNAGNVYVSDSANNTIRKITPEGLASTLAGLSGQAGGTDGTGLGARFSNPQGLAADAEGNIYVADSGGDSVRKITPAGVVTTLALPGPVGPDGPQAELRFNRPGGVAVDKAGNVYVADANNQTIRKIALAPVK